MRSNYLQRSCEIIPEIFKSKWPWKKGLYNMIRINSPKLINMCNSCSKMHHTSHKYTTTQYGYAFIERNHKNITEHSKLDHKSNISHPAIVNIPSLKLSTSSKLNHEIKCVTNSYYEDLGLESTASSIEIKEAFYR